MRRYDITFLLIIFLLLTPFVLGVDFLGYKYSGDNFTLNGDNFTVQLSKDSKSLYIKYNDEGMILLNNSCKETQQKIYFICLNSMIVDFEKDIGKIDERSGDVIPGLNMTFSYRKQNISINRTISEKAPLIMEEINGTITIINNGKNPTSIDYIEIIPQDIEILNTEGLSKQNNVLRHIGNLNPGAAINLRYTLKPLKSVSADIYGNLTFSYESLKNVIALEKIRIKTNDTVTLKTDYSEVININENSSLVLSLKNNDVFSSTIADLSFSLPKELSVKYVSSEEVTETENQSYKFHTSLEKDDEKEIELDFISTKTGSYVVPISLKYTTYGVIELVQKNMTIKVIAGKITPLIVINNEELMGNQRVIVSGVLKNNDNVSSYHNLNATIESNIVKKVFFADKIEKKEEIKLFDEEIYIPNVNKSTSFVLKFFGSYLSINNESFNFTTTKTIKVEPVSNMVLVYHEIDNFSNEPNKTRITVYIENKRSILLRDIEVTESSPGNVKFVDGETKKIMSIDSKRKIQAYTYTVEYLDNKTTNVLVTSLEFNESGREIILSQPIIINTSSKITSSLGSTTNVSLINNVNNNTNQNNINLQSKNLTNNKNVTQGYQDDKNNKKSLWQKFIDWLSNI